MPPTLAARWRTTSAPVERLRAGAAGRAGRARPSASDADLGAELLEHPHGRLAEEAGAAGDRRPSCPPRSRRRGSRPSWLERCTLPASWSSSAATSASTMSSTSSSKRTFGSQPSFWPAPCSRRRSSASTSAGGSSAGRSRRARPSRGRRGRRRPRANSRTRVRLAGGDHVVVGLVGLQHQPHRLDVVGGVAPVALRRRGCRGRACPAGRP